MTEPTKEEWAALLPAYRALKAEWKAGRQPAVTTRARLEALEAAALKWMSENEALGEAPPDCECSNCRIYKALRSAGIETEGEGK